MRDIDTLSIAVRVYRQMDKPKTVVIRYVIDDLYGAEQEHKLQSTTGAIGWQTISEAIEKIISRIVERSVFNDASPPGTAAALPSQAQTAQGS